ncbi:hypothetical protein F4553_000352 [Allocatelliglobosispora scoriae]|uniref:LuxR family transcriptional regulator n=1 Tax=Allocatelliglobosispora scoriae TaxID=643052 RepID=A0A841BIT9_9ACTN|nr:hypothetical protein [Allocatelliglobosispora scoriae]MBB5866973.1 hypothetical protein [Allocatelliglobosispora scoriae]
MTDGAAPHDPDDCFAEMAADQCALLDRLADGQTIAAAAAGEFLSLRTANRRVADLRERRGVGTTRELVAAYVRWRMRR